MKDLKYYQTIIQDKRKQTDFRDFLMEIGSWYSMVLYRDEKGLSRYPVTDRIWKLSSIKEFEENRSELIKWGLEYNSDKTFFENFQILFLSVEHQRMLARNSENCDYVDDVIDSADSYLSFAVIIDCSNVLYSFLVKENCHDVVNSMNVLNNCSYIYMSSGIMNSYNIFYSSNCLDLSDIWLSSNMLNCTHCIMCDGLESQKYCIESKQYSKSDYLDKKEALLRDKESFQKYRNNLNKQLSNFWSENVSWNAILESSDIENGAYLYRVHGWRNLIMVAWSEWDKEIYDTIIAWAYKADNMYGVTLSWLNSNDIYCSYSVWINASYVFYSYFLDTCSYCIWCIGLQNKSYCILNKQYSKEDWHIMADRIFWEMEQGGALWEFFPWEINPLYFNDTIAGLIGWFSKQEALDKWYMWRDEQIKVDIPEWSDVIKTSELWDYQWYDANGNWRINPEILKQVIVDEKWDYYRIVKPEYDFLVKHSLPLPETHWMDRIKLNFWM